MVITIEHLTNLSPENTLGTHAVGVDGVGSLFVIWRNGLNVRVQRYDREHNILTPWFTAFTVSTMTLSHPFCVYPFVSGGCAVVYFSNPITGKRIHYECLDRNGIHVSGSSGSFPADFDLQYPQLVCATDAKDTLAIVYMNESANIIVQMVIEMTTGKMELLPSFQLNTMNVAPQVASKYKSLLSATSNWVGGDFAALYMRRSDGNGLVRKFNRTGIMSKELNIMETLRSCNTGGANRGLPCLRMEGSSERLLLINPIIPVTRLDPPTHIRTTVYNETLTGTSYSTVHKNPLSMNMMLTCLGGAYYPTGNSTFVIDDENSNMNVFYLDTTGDIISTVVGLASTTNYLTGDSIVPSVEALGDRSAASFHDSGSNFILSMKLSEERHIRSFSSETMDIIRNPTLEEYLDDTFAVSDLTNPNTVVVSHGLRPNTSLDDFIGSRNIALIGGPINNISTAELFSDTGRLGYDFKTILARNGIFYLQFTNLSTAGFFTDDRHGISTNAPQIRVSVPYGDFVIARHQIGSTIYDYGLALRIAMNKACYLFAGIRDISTEAAASWVLTGPPEWDNPYENFDAVLVITTYPASITKIADYVAAKGTSNVTVRFRPLVGIRENSPLK